MINYVILLLTIGELISALTCGGIPCGRIKLLLIGFISIFWDVNERVLAGRDDDVEQSTFNHGLISWIREEKNQYMWYNLCFIPLWIGIWNSTRWVRFFSDDLISSDESVCRLLFKFIFVWLWSFSSNLKRTRRPAVDVVNPKELNLNIVLVVS
jgi:hypothetical protein